MALARQFGLLDAPEVSLEARRALNFRRTGRAKAPVPGAPAPSGP
jgi:hypothetical protein